MLAAAAALTAVVAAPSGSDGFSNSVDLLSVNSSDAGKVLLEVKDSIEKCFDVHVTPVPVRREPGKIAEVAFARVDLPLESEGCVDERILAILKEISWRAEEDCNTWLQNLDPWEGGDVLTVKCGKDEAEYPPKE